MPPIASFSYSMQRDKEWDSVAAVHSGLNIVTTWSLEKKKMGSHKLVPENMPNSVTATCATVSCCGNFVFIGTYIPFIEILIFVNTIGEVKN